MLGILIFKWFKHGGLIPNIELFNFKLLNRHREIREVTTNNLSVFTVFIIL